MHSRIYVGQVNHRRIVPRVHDFTYKLFMLYLDLDELPRLFDRFMFWSVDRFNLASFKRSHYMGGGKKPLKQAVIDQVRKQTGIHLTGPIRLLTNLSYFGYGFNPVSFYYCFDETDSEVVMIVAEVNNTPWGEQHCYYLPGFVADNLSDNKSDDLSNNPGNSLSATQVKHKLKKEFHVSPFNPMEMHYEWDFTLDGENLVVYMQNFSNDEKVFDATLSLKQQPINAASLRKVLLNFPLMTLKIILAIYYEALKLWLKGTPVHTHPEKIKRPLTERK